MNYGVLKGVTLREDHSYFIVPAGASVRAQSNNRLSAGLNVENLRSVYEYAPPRHSPLARKMPRTRCNKTRDRERKKIPKPKI